MMRRPDWLWIAAGVLPAAMLGWLGYIMFLMARAVLS